MSGFRAPLFALGLSVSAAVAPSPGFSSPLFLLGLSTTQGVAPPPVVESGYLGGGPIEYLIDDDEEILAVIMAYMGMRNVH